MTNDAGYDRRKYPRVATEALVSVARVDSSDLLGWSLDLSQGGIRFQWIGLEVEVGELLRVTLDLEGHQVSAVGRVLRVAALDAIAREVALAFVEADARTLELLRDHLEGEAVVEGTGAAPPDRDAGGQGDGQPPATPHAGPWRRVGRLLRRLPLVNAGRRGGTGRG